MSLLYIIQKPGDLVSVAKVEFIKNVRFDLRYKACNWWIVGKHLDLYIVHCKVLYSTYAMRRVDRMQ